MEETLRGNSTWPGRRFPGGCPGRRGVCRPSENVLRHTALTARPACGAVSPPLRRLWGCCAGEQLLSAALWLVCVPPAKPHGFCLEGHPRRPPAARSLWETRTWPQRLPAREPGAALLFLAEQAADGRLDALLLGGFVERVLAAVAAAGVAHGAVLRACRASGTENNLEQAPSPRDTPSM